MKKINYYFIFDGLLRFLGMFGFVCAMYLPMMRFLFGDWNMWSLGVIMACYVSVLMFHLTYIMFPYRRKHENH